MQSIWIVLLDISGSMNNGFSGAVSPGEATEAGAWQTKIEAAKELLKNQVMASNVQDIAIITFGDVAEKRFHGSRADFLKVESSFMALEASSSRTDLAGALDLVADDPSFEPYPALSVLALSDGLANVGNPEASASRIINKYPHSRIDTILIDVTEEGERYARAISLNGWVRPATSFFQLASSLSQGRRASLTHGLAALTQQRFALEYELATLQELAQPSLLTVLSPVELTPASLTGRIGPTLKALERLELVVADLEDQPHEVKVNSISQSSPISISLSGLDTALNAVLEIFIPWRRRHAQELAQIQNERLRLENRRLEEEVNDLASARDVREASAEREMWEAKRRRNEEDDQRSARRLESRLLEMKLEIAAQLLERLSDGLGKDPAVYKQQVLEAVELLLKSGVDFKLEPRPQLRFPENK